MKCAKKFEVHLHAKAMDAWMSRVMDEYPHVEWFVFSSDNSPTQYRLASAFEYYQSHPQLKKSFKFPFSMEFEIVLIGISVISTKQ